MRDILFDKFNRREAKVVVIGVGYVGFPLAIGISKSGFEVHGLDINESKVRSILSGVSEDPSVSTQELQVALSTGRFHCTTSKECLSTADAVVICVPTPLDKFLQPDLRFVEQAARDVARYKKDPVLVILESTTYPGTTEEVLAPILCPDKQALGKSVYLAYSPERIDPGNKAFHTLNTPKVVGGCTRDCRDLGRAFYEAMGAAEVFVTSSPRVAEMEKLLENTFRLVNISLVNEVAILCDKMDIDIWEVIDAAKTKPYGFMAFYPGPGPGGHCIPIDPYYLTWKAKEHRVSLGLIEKAEEIIHEMPNYVVSKTIRILNEEKKCLNGAKVLILGVTYKKDIADFRESPALRILERLLQLQADVRIVDPMVTTFTDETGREFETSPMTEENLRWADIALLTTDHSVFDSNFILKHSNKIYDTRNMFKERCDRVVRL